MKAQNAVPTMVICALAILSSIDGAVSPKFPSLKVTVPITMSDTMNTAAAAKTGWQRAATQSTAGNSSTTATHISHQSDGSMKMTMPAVAATTMSAATPSITSRRDSGARKVATSPMIIGATAMMPIASEATHCRQTVQAGSSGL